MRQTRSRYGGAVSKVVRHTDNTASSLLFSANDHAAAEAEEVIGVVDDAVLAGGDALDFLVGFDAVEVADAAEEAWGEIGGMTDLEGDGFGVGEFAPGILGDEVEALEVDGAAVLSVGVVTVGDVDDVAADVFPDDEPRATAEAESFTLPDGMEPIAVVLAKHFARFEFDNLAGTTPEVAFDEIVVVDLAEEAYTLAVFAHGAGELLGFGYGTDFALHQVADREHELLDLEAGDLGEKVGLILQGILSCREPDLTVYLGGGGVVAGGDLVEVAPPTVFKAAELDELVAHHVGVRGEAALDRVDGIADHFVPVFFVQGNDLHAAAVAAGDVSSNLDIFFGRTVYITVFIFHADTDVKDGWVVTSLFELVDDYGAVDSSGY